MPHHVLLTRHRLPLLAAGALGGQCVWSTEMAFASPYLLHLGMSKTKMSIVFVAGPLSGLIVAPLIGVISDNSTSPWGRRRPLLVLACLLCSVFLLQLGFARSLAGILTSDEVRQTNLTIILVVFAIFSIDFSVNAVNALDKALLMDLVPSSDQSLANAWSARLSGMGAIFGFLIGQTDLASAAPSFLLPKPSLQAQDIPDGSEAQLRCVCILVVFLLITTHIITVTFAREEPSPSVATPSNHGNIWERAIGWTKSTVTDLCSAAKILSRPIWEIFRVQFFLWIAWFPVLFYSTSWVGAIAQASLTSTNAAAAMRLGSLAMLYHAIVSIAGTTVLPPLLTIYNRGHPHRSRESLSKLWSIAIFSLALALLASWIAERYESTTGAMAIVALTGFAWALTTWTPFALLGILAQKETESGLRCDRDVSMATMHRDEYSPLPQSRVEDEEAFLSKNQGLEQQSGSAFVDGGDAVGMLARESLAIHTSSELARGIYSHPNGTGQHSGTILGLHNLSLVIPQFLTSILTTILFSIIEPGAKPLSGAITTEGLDEREQHRSIAAAFGLTMRLGSISALVAAALAFRMARTYKDELESY